MRASPTWPLWVSILLRTTVAVVPISSVRKGDDKLGSIVANKFIVELDDISELKDLTPRQLLSNFLKGRDVGLEVDKEFAAEGLFNGAVLTIKDSEGVQELLALPGVRAVRPVRRLSRPTPVKWQRVQDKADPAIPPDTFSTHVLTGVDKVHAEGVIGTGVKIGILDTGIDYNHPALGAGFGPGHKVVGGFDLVGDAYDGTNTPVPDPDPLDVCAGHGTHVAGIIGADPGNPFNISGVAYGASISAYRVFGCEGFVTDDVLVDALIRGFTDGQDILTLSLGGPDGWTESSSSVVASRIAATGRIVTIAAGNDGASGSWYTSSPGNGINVISVASLDNTVIALQTAVVGGATHSPIPYFDLFPFPVTGPLPVYALSNSTTVVDDACAPLPPTVPDLSNFVVIIRRGTCTFVQKLTNAAAKGAKIALIYDNGTGFNAISVGDFNASLIQKEDGEFLVSQFAAGVPITLTFPQTGGVIEFPNPAGGLVSSFSTYGPTNDFFFKPSINAPGGNILSTLPLNGYGIASGTSMATPFVAGSAALLFSVKGKSRQVGITARTLFETTARAVPSSHTDGDPLQTVTQQGAGLINVFDAIHATTIVDPGQLILNDTAHFKGTQRFTVRNTGRTSKRYTLSHVPAGTAITVQPGTIFPSLGPVPLTTAAATVVLSPSTFTLAAGQTRTITATFTPPAGVDASTYPTYSGFIQVTSGTDIKHVSYLGLAASLKDKQTLDDTDFFFGVPLPLVLDAVGDVQTEPTNYTFVGGDFPSILWRQAFGTPAFRVDLIDAATSFKPSIEPRADPGSPTFTFPQRPRPAQVAITGPVLAINYLTRNDEGSNGFNSFDLSTATFSNGTTIPKGSYRFLVRSLRVTGSPNAESDYDSWLSPIIGVV